MMSLAEFALQMAKVGCVGFGGGNALIPIIEKTFLTDAGLDTKENFDRDIITANITPGALPLELASGLGNRSFGKKGMVVGAVMMALPGALGSLLLFTLLSSAQSGVLKVIKTASVGISAFIIFLLLHYIENVLVTCYRDNRTRFCKSIFVIVCVCLLACGGNFYKLIGSDRTPLFAVPTVYILLAAFFVVFYTRSVYSAKHLAVCGALCAVFFLGHGKSGLFQGSPILYAAQLLMAVLAAYGLVSGIRSAKWTHTVDKKRIYQEVAIWAVFLAVFSVPALLVSAQALRLLGQGALSVLMSFGGGDAYLTIADGLFVEGGMVSPEIYYGDIVSVVNILPGSILCKTLLGVGYYTGLSEGGSVAAGVILGLAGFACSIAVSCCVFGVVAHLYDSLAASKAFRVISRWIRSIIAGLLINVILSLLNQTTLAVSYTGASVARILCVAAALVIADHILNKLKNVKYVWLLAINLIAVFLLL